MEKKKLAEMRDFKGFTQQQVAEQLCMCTTAYHRREKGIIQINITEWEKIAKLFDVPLSEIFEPDEKLSVIFNDQSSGNYQGTTNIYAVPKSLLENQQKYIALLEEKIERLKQS